MIKCNVCGHEFEAVTDKHYITRDCGTTGIKAITGEAEPFLYDTYDCPKCGSQYTAQIRKRIYEPAEADR